MSKPTEKQLNRLAEVIRESGSNDDAYQHMLDLIAEDLADKYGYGRIDLVDAVQFITHWRPANDQAHGRAIARPVEHLVGQSGCKE
jgi:thioredoxin-like negative regulator of GroEL